MNDRGGNDWRGSTDFEDIIYVVDNRTYLLAELRTTDKEVLAFLKSEFGKLLSKSNLEELIACTLLSNSDEERIHFVVNVIQQIVEL